MYSALEVISNLKLSSSTGHTPSASCCPLSGLEDGCRTHKTTHYCLRRGRTNPGQWHRECQHNTEGFNLVDY